MEQRVAGWKADVSRETMEKLAAFESLLRTWSRRINLVGSEGLSDLRVRHTDDCAQLLDHIPEDAKRLADLGSGGGFPGIVLAVLAQGTRPRLETHLVESDQRKAAFLLVAAQTLDLPVSVHAERIEKLGPLAADVVTARALAPLDRLLPLVVRHLSEDGTAILPKGQMVQREIADARNQWTFDIRRAVPSQTGDGTVLVLQNIRVRS